MVPKDPIADVFAWKQTSSADLVVKRKLEIFTDRFCTYHNVEKDPGSKRCWFLDPSCTLDPARPEQMVAKKKGVRPPGKWTVTATLFGTDQTVEVVSVVASRLRSLLSLACTLSPPLTPFSSPSAVLLLHLVAQELGGQGLQLHHAGLRVA